VPDIRSRLRFSPPRVLPIYHLTQGRLRAAFRVGIGRRLRPSVRPCAGRSGTSLGCARAEERRVNWIRWDVQAPLFGRPVMPRRLRPAAHHALAEQDRLAHRSRAEDVPVSFLRAGRDVMLSVQSGAAEVMSKHPFTGVTNEARQACADKRAAQLAPILKELQAAGVTSLRAIAAALNERAIPTATGYGRWHHVQIGKVLARLPA
jgi:hypothetical protein